MGALTDIWIKFEIEPVMKLVCHAFDCKNNLYRVDGAYCNLKHIEISEKHECMNHEKSAFAADSE